MSAFHDPDQAHTLVAERQRLDAFFHFGISVDCVVFGFDGTDLQILAIERGADPFKGFQALPGDLVRPDEDTDAASLRVLHDLTGLPDIYLEQLHTFGQVDRHPMGRVVTVAYYSLIDIRRYAPQPGSWASQAQWVPIEKIAHMAFDHARIVSVALSHLQHRIRHRPIGFELLTEEFTLAQLQLLYEAILGTQFDKANFRKKILAMNLLQPLEKMQRAVRHRPARLYRFDAQRYTHLMERGFLFEL
jgi:8-oxo-dGTP diphosphatase